MSRLSHRAADEAAAEVFMRNMYLSLGLSTRSTERAIKLSKLQGMVPLERHSLPLKDDAKVVTRRQHGQKASRGRNQDRARVAGGQKYEVAYEAKKTGKPAAAVKRAVKKVGNNRKKVGRALSR